jgi:alkylated DNA repair dioxygenase AlkB
LPAPSKSASDAICALVGAPFNLVDLNLYRDGNDSVAPHRDKTENGRRVQVDLENGSCLVMSHTSQSTREHGIPKIAGIDDPRISLALLRLMA